MATKAAVLVAVLLVLPVVTALAHSPINYTVPPDSFGRAADVRDPTVSRVIYRELTLASSETWIRFRGKAGQRIPFNMGVPVIDRLASFRPAVALVGPGLPGADLPFALPPGAGAVVYASPYPPGEAPPVFHEEFTGTDSWMHLKDAVTLPEAGEYYLVVFVPPPRDPTGKAWLAVGTKERFTLREILSFGRIRRAVREFHEIR